MLQSNQKNLKKSCRIKQENPCSDKDRRTTHIRGICKKTTSRIKNCNAKQNNAKEDCGKAPKKEHDDESDEMEDIDNEECEENDENEPGAILDFRPGHYMKAIKEDFTGCFASAVEDESNDLFHIQYFNDDDDDDKLFLWYGLLMKGI